MPRVSLINPDGRVNRAAVFMDARRQYRLMSRLGWSWRECLRYSWLRARAWQHNADQARMEKDLSRTEELAAE